MVGTTFIASLTIYLGGKGKGEDVIDNLDTNFYENGYPAVPIFLFNQIRFHMLIVLIEEEHHPELQRDNLNVIYDMHISFTDAVFGANPEVPTIDGRAKIKIPAGTQSGKIFRLKGKGFPSINSYEKGDQLIHINIWTPQTLSAEEKELMEKLKDAKNFQPQPEKNEKSFYSKMKEMFS